MILSILKLLFRCLVSYLPMNGSLGLPLLLVFTPVLAQSNGDNPLETKQEHSTPTLSVLANDSVDTKSLSLNEIRSIFSLRARQWPNGEPITVLVYHDDSSTHREFSLDKLKMLPHQLRRQWNRYIYSGTGIGPLTVTNKQEMLDTLSQTRGAIGYTYTGVPHENVRTISVD